MEKKQFIGSDGFTLIEVLISTLLLGMVLTIATMTYTGFMDVWQKSNQLFASDFVSARHQILLRESIESVYDYYIRDRSGMDTQKIYFPFFKGESSSAEFITHASVFNHGGPAAARLYAQKNNSGKYNLIYEEADLETFFLKYMQEKVKYSRQITIFQDLDLIKFRFYGFLESKMNLEMRRVDDIFGWNENYMGMQTKHIPSIVEITVNSGETGRKKMIFKIMTKNKYKNGIFNPPYEKS